MPEPGPFPVPVTGALPDSVRLLFMNKKTAISLALAWALSMAVLYQLRSLIALSSLALNGVPDEAFRFAPGVERAIIGTAAGFSVMVALLGAAFSQLASRWKRGA